MQQCKCRAYLSVEGEASLHHVSLTSSFSVSLLSSRVQIEFMFVHTNRGQGRPSEPRSLRPHHVRDDHRRPCCEDSQDATGGGHRRGTAVFSNGAGWMYEHTLTWHHPPHILSLWPCRMSASLTAQGRTQGSMFTLSCASPSSLPSGTSLPSWSCNGTGARSPSTSATRRSVWPRGKKHTPKKNQAHRMTVGLEFVALLDLPDLVPWEQLSTMLLFMSWLPNTGF